MGVWGYREMEAWRHSPDCGPLGWERKGVFGSMFTHTHICRGAERQGALSQALSVPHPVTETFWGGGWPKKGISTMS